MEQTPDNALVLPNEIDAKMWNLLSKEPAGKHIDLNELQAKFFDTYGVICSSSHLSSGRSGSSLKRLETDGRIQVFRNPSVKNGKPARFWTEKDGETVEIMRK